MKRIKLKELDLRKIIKRIVLEQDSPANPCQNVEFCCESGRKHDGLSVSPVFDRYDEENDRYICKCPAGSRKTRCNGLNETKYQLNEQGGTSWCNLCMQTNPPTQCQSYGQPCHANFDKDSISCSSCKALFSSQNPGLEQQSINNHCNQVGQPCYTTVTPYETPGKDWAQAAETSHAKKAPDGSDNPDTIKLRESDLQNIIRKIISRR